MWLRVSTDNLATGNWHNDGKVGGWWTAYLNNRIEQDHAVTGDAWPAAAVAVMANAGIEPSAGDNAHGAIRPRPNPYARTKDGELPAFHVPSSITPTSARAPPPRASTPPRP